MQKHIWDPLFAKSTTFFPTKHFLPELMPPLQETGYRSSATQPSQNLILGPPLWTLEPRDALGGAGLYSTANEYIKLLSCLVSGGGPLLSEQSTGELFRPQALSSGSETALRNFLTFPSANMAPIWRRSEVDASEELMPMGHSLVGPVNLADVPGRRKRGSVCWCGLPNLSWWIDPESGIAATVFTQVLPPVDPPSIQLLVELENALYKLVKESKT
jgi:CubicO group peptidase (beta-lactamase class C family)